MTLYSLDWRTEIVQVAFSRYFCWEGCGGGDVTRVEGGSIESKEEGVHPKPSQSLVENIIMTECTQERGQCQSMHSLVCGLKQDPALQRKTHLCVPEKELRTLSPNFHIHVSGSD